MRNKTAYWRVEMNVYAFDTQADAEAFSNTLINRFCFMPESDDYASSTRVVACNADGDEIPSNT